MSSVVIQGDTSGSVTIQAPAISGSTVINLPTITGAGGSFIVTDSSNNLSLSSNLTFTGTGNRIRGDFSNATIANRVAFQTSATNTNTVLEVIPNGSATTATLNLESDSTVLNSSLFSIQMNGGTDARLSSLLRGTGTYLPITFYTSGSERARIDTSGNVGIGVTPSAWLSTWKAIQLGATSAFSDFSNQSSYLNNAYVGAGTTPFYLTTAPASFYRQTTGQHLWFNAPSGTAGAAITFTQAMTLDASGNLIVKGTDFAPASPSRLHVIQTGTSYTSGLTISPSGDGNDGLSLYQNATNNPTAIIENVWDRPGAPVYSDILINPSGGNIGIGTASPGVKLDVVGTMRANTSVVAGNSSYGITINQNTLTFAGANSTFVFTKPVPTISNASRFDFNTGSLNTGILAGPWWNGVHFNAQDAITNASAGTEFPRTSHYYSYSTVTNPTDLNYNIVTGNSTVPQHMTIGTATSANIKFLIANAEAMRIDYNKNVGIGTNAPAYKLDIGSFSTGTKQTLRIAATTDTELKLMETADTYGFTIRNVAASGLNIFRHSADATGTTALYIGRDTGLVGLGTNNPQAALHVYSGDIMVGNAAGATSRMFRAVEVGVAGNNAGIAFGGNGSKGSIFGQSGTGGLWIVGSSNGGSQPLNFGYSANDTSFSANTVSLGAWGITGLGIGTNAPATRLYVSGSAASNNATLTDGATITPDFTQSNNFSVTLAGNRTMANPTGLTVGQSGVIFITQDATGSRTLAWGTSWDWANAGVPVLTTAANAIDVVAYTVRTATSIVAQIIQNIG